MSNSACSELRRLLLAALLLTLLPSLAVAVPQRIVSINLCADLLLLSLLPRERITSLSPYAADPARSPLAHAATGIAVNHGHVEEIVALRPDLVLAGRFNSPETLSLLRRLEVPLLLLDVPASLEQAKTQLLEVAAAVDARAEGERLMEQMDRRLASAAASLQGASEAPLAVAYRQNGYTAGAGTLVDAVFRRAGLRNLAAELGVVGWGTLDLETLLRGDAALLVLDVGEDHPSLASASLRHPVLRLLTRERAVVEIPASLWTCAGPWTVRVVERLAAARRALSPP